jgi:hypothetical protein
MGCDTALGDGAAIGPSAVYRRVVNVLRYSDPVAPHNCIE